MCVQVKHTPMALFDGVEMRKITGVILTLAERGQTLCMKQI